MKRLAFTAVSVISLVAIAFVFTLSGPAHASTGGSVGSGGGTPGTSSNFTLVGHDPLFNRGMPYEGNVGITSRELRVWPQQKLLMVMNFRCSSVIHVCPRGNDTIFPFDIKFFDLSNPVHPTFLLSYVPTSRAGIKVKPHEMFLWVDPNHPDRALLYLSTPTLSVAPTSPTLLIADISAVPGGGPVTEVTEGNWNGRYPGASNPANYNFNLFVHSMGLTADGTRAYLAMEAGEFLVLDTSDVANNVPNPQLRLVTDPVNRPIWGPLGPPGARATLGAHHR